MQRKPGYPVANCSIKMPDTAPSPDSVEEEEPAQRRQQLINFGHSQWGFNNWNWAVTKQDLDFAEASYGRYAAGVATFVSVSVKSLDLRRENVGYATALAPTKGLAIHRARKCAVTNALRETLLSFGGAVAAELLELDAQKEPASEPQADVGPRDSALACKPPPALAAPPVPPVPLAAEPKNCPVNKNIRKEEIAPLRPMQPPANSMAPPPPVAKALPMPVNLPPAANRPPQPQPPRAPQPHPPQPQVQPHPRPNSNEVRGECEEARAERKRRQRQAQEEFRLKQLQRQGQVSAEEKQELDTNSSSVDKLLMAIPSQDISEPAAKRPALADGAAPRRCTPPDTNGAT